MVPDLFGRVMLMNMHRKTVARQPSLAVGNICNSLHITPMSAAW